MNPVNVKKDWLLEQLRSNRDKHHAVFLDAVAGYGEQAQRVLAEHLERLRAGKRPRIAIILERPEDHTRDYDRVIGMLQAHQDELYELDERSYAQFVDDDWQWKQAWLSTSTQYAGASVTANYGPSDEA